MKQTAKFISIIFHPLLLPVYAIIFIFSQHQSIYFISFEAKKSIVIIFFILTFVAPVLSILLMKNFKMISSIYLHERKDRFLPYSIVISYYLICYLVFQKVPVKFPFYINDILLIASISTLITFIFNFKTKLSAHAVSVGSFITYAIFFIKIQYQQTFYYAILFLLIAGLIGFSRLFLNRHNPQQVYSGFIVGSSASLIYILTLL